MPKIPKVVLIGQPNCGKSTLFNSIAGYKAKTSNFPGTTVKYSESRVNVAGRVANVVDLPGIYSLASGGVLEKETLHFLLNEDIDMIVNVVDASLLARSLEFTIELLELGKPMVIALNMMDEAQAKGIKIDVKKLSEILGVPVVPTIAVRGKGIVNLFKTIFAHLSEKPPEAPHCSPRVEEAIGELLKYIKDKDSKRLLAIKFLERDPYFLKLMEKEGIEVSELEKIKRELEEKFGISSDLIIHRERHQLALSIYESVTKIERKRTLKLEDRADAILMHPILGYIFLALVFTGFFFIVFAIGSPLEEFLLGPIDKIRESVSGIDGLWGYLIDGFLQGVGGGLAVVLPYFVPLIFLTSFLEDIGYLPRAAFLLDTFMHKIGIHGKSVIPFILSYGCTVPAITATRMIESERDRTITALMAPFIPCSARTTVILALMAYYLGPLAAIALYVFNLIIVSLVGKLISNFFPYPSPGLIMEIPPYRLPSFRITLRKTYAGLKDFLYFAWPILVLGSIFLSFLQYFGVDKIINTILSPYTAGVLGLPSVVGITLIFGILRKELSLIMLMQALGTTNVLSVIGVKGIVLLTVFITFFIPCLSTLAVMQRELGTKIMLYSVTLNTTVATLITALLRLIFLLI